MKAELLEPDDWQEYRKIRLAALADAPSAFDSTLTGALTLGEADWRERLTGNAVMYVVRADGQAGGLAGGYAEDGQAHLISMWVAPFLRGRGAGDALIGAVLGWAADAGHQALWLWVTIGNDPARLLYERHGFRATGKVQPVRPEEPGLLEQEMVLHFAPETSAPQ